MGASKVDDSASPMVRFFGRLSFFEDGEKRGEGKSESFTDTLSPKSIDCKISCADESFLAADELEKGVGDLTAGLYRIRHPPAPSEKLHRCMVVRNAKTGDYQLLTEEKLVVIMTARIVSKTRVDFLLPGEEDEAEDCYSGRRPAFIMTHNKEADEWLLIQPRCDFCVHKPHHLTCDFFGKNQQVAHVRHSRRKVEEANVHYVDVHVPPLVTDLSSVWCPAWTGKDLGSPSPGGASRGSPTASTPTSNRSIFFFAAAPRGQRRAVFEDEATCLEQRTECLDREL